jgi:outer membrane protein OmpA-like peptidoglycan-associated protein
MLFGLVALSATARAQAAGPLPLRARTSVGAATMISDSQRNWLGYDSLGAVGTLELGYALAPSLEVRAGAAFGGFPGGDHTGGLLQPQLGAAVLWPERSARPWLQLDAGLGFTGALVRPVLRVSAGVDFQLTSTLSLGPVLGYTQIFQHDRPHASTDARFVWFGFAFGLGPAQKVAAPRVREQVITRVRTITHERTLDLEPEPPPASEIPATEPSPELSALLETALPTQRQEWLAPVLFALDSAELQPQGVAMLHEVSRELHRRTKIRAVEIRGYADARGSTEYNLQLSERRAQVVRAWLISHGVASERLRIAAHGASDLLEAGGSEPEQAQNRRVVFRVVETEGSP